MTNPDFPIVDGIRNPFMKINTEPIPAGAGYGYVDGRGDDPLYGGLIRYNHQVGGESVIGVSSPWFHCPTRIAMTMEIRYSGFDLEAPEAIFAGIAQAAKPLPIFALRSEVGTIGPRYVAGGYLYDGSPELTIPATVTQMGVYVGAKRQLLPLPIQNKAYALEILDEGKMTFTSMHLTAMTCADGKRLS